MQKDIVLFGQTVTVRFYISTYEKEPSTEKVQTHEIQNFARYLKNEHRMFFTVQPETPITEQTRFVLNRIEYGRIEGAFYVLDDTPRLNITARSVVGSNYRDDLTDSARAKMRAELLPHMIEAYKSLQDLKTEAWEAFIESLNNAAQAKERRALELREFAGKYPGIENVLDNQWRTENGKVYPDKYSAYRAAKEAGQPEIYEEIYRITTGEVLQTTVHALPSY